MSKVRILNCFIESLNKYHTIPRFVIIFPDWDIVRYLNYEAFGISHIIGKCVEWLVEEFSKAISIKKEDMRSVRPGSVTTLEPKFIWVKMIERPGHAASKHMLNREKFNAVLEQTLHGTKSMYIMGIERKTIDKSCFDMSSGLNSRGKCAYWAEFDRMLRKFDKQELSLRPEPIISNALKKQKEKQK